MGGWVGEGNGGEEGGLNERLHVGGWAGGDSSYRLGAGESTAAAHIRTGGESNGLNIAAGRKGQVVCL